MKKWHEDSEVIHRRLDQSLTDSEDDEARLSLDPEDYPEFETMSIEDLIKHGVPISDMVRRKERKTLSL